MDKKIQFPFGEVNIPLEEGGGNVYYAIQATEAYYDTFVAEHQTAYEDGSVSIHNTIQDAIDATTIVRDDVVIVIGEWDITTPILLNKYGVTLMGLSGDSQMGGKNSKITSTVAADSVITMSAARTAIENIMLFMNGTGLTSGIRIHGGSQLRIRNVCIVKNDGTDNSGYGINITAAPTWSLFENIKITGKINNTLRLQRGISGASYNCIYRNILVSNTEGQGLYIPTSGGDLFENIVLAPTVTTGLEITGTGSMLVNCRNMAATEGVSTAIKSGCITIDT